MKKLLTITALLAASFGAQAANLVVDGSFEDQSQAAGSWSVYNSISGWSTVSGSGIEVRNNVAGTAYDGSNFVELDSNNNSAMAQTLATQAGTVYTLSFEYSARPGVTGASNPIQVSWNGATVATVQLDGTSQSDNIWHLYSYSVVGTGHDTLSLAAVGTDDSLGGAIDAVSVTAPVPEPSSWALMIGGLAVIGGVLKRRRAQR